MRRENPNGGPHKDERTEAERQGRSNLLGLRALVWSWTEGVALFSSGQGSTSMGRNPLDRAKPFDIPKREYGNLQAG